MLHQIDNKYHVQYYMTQWYFRLERIRAACYVFAFDLQYIFDYIIIFWCVVVNFCLNRINLQSGPFQKLIK